MPEHVVTADLFVGRADELRRIEAACRAAANGRGSLTVVSGEPGIGKTRFCQEAADRARRAGMTTVVARCWVDGGAPALWPWPPVLTELCGVETADLLAADAPDGAGATEVAPPAVDPDRFARFAAVTDRLEAACARSPVCLVIDDVHAADAGTLLLIRFVARSLPRLRLALVLSRRTGEPSGGPADDRLGARLLDEMEREALPIVLRHLDLGEASALLRSEGLGDLDADVVLALLRVTSGNPLFLRRIAALGPPAPTGALPGGLHVAIAEALARLTLATQRLLRASAVLGLTPSVTEAASVGGTGPASVLDAVNEAAAAGLVTTNGTDRFAFTHELVRAALEEGLPASERLDVHARAARAVAGVDAAVPAGRLARRAHHALAAAPRSPEDARLAVQACQAAARSMVTCFAYEQADTLLSAAVELHDRPGLGPPSGRLLVEWAQAALLCGRLGEARVRFDRAAAVADGEGDPALFAEAALGLGGHWLNEHRAPVERARVLALQRSALSRLPDDHEALRCRLRTRLAAEAVYDGEPTDPVLGALSAARRCGDLTALAEGLSLCHHALLAPEHAHRRLGLADELVRVGSEAGHGVLALMGLCWRAVDLFLLGDERASRALEDLRQRADALACRNIGYIVDVIDVMLLIRAGRLDDAEAAATRCYELGLSVGEVDAVGYLGAHTLAIRWIQGRDAELLDLAEEVAASPTLVQAEFAFRATTAAIAARAGERDRARAALARLAGDGLAALPRSSTWLAGMVAIVETAAALADGRIAREAYDLLLPFADRPVMPSLAVACLGSAELTLGTAALTFGDTDRAIGHLERAVAANRRLANRPLAAIAEAELARALRHRSGAGDVTRATDLFGRAVREADSMGMSGRAAHWRAELPAVPVPQPAVGPDGGLRGGDEGPRTGVFRREGRGWLVALDGRQVLVADLVGMGYLAQLLRHPGQDLPALTLAGAAPGAGDSGRQELLDDQARLAYLARARELSEDLAEAEANADIVRAERLRAELDVLVDQVEAATGLHGRARTFSTQAERARTAVRKAIKRAMDEIDAADPRIGKLLHSSVTTGTTCAYTPDPDAPVAWSTD